MKLMNAAGTCRDHATAWILAGSVVVEEIVIGSYTPDKSVGLPNAYYYDRVTRTSYNAKRMPNCGLDELLRELPDYLTIVKDSKKKLRISIAAPTIVDFIDMVEQIMDLVGVDIVHVRFEFNPSCPNSKAMFNAYDPSFIENLVRKLSADTFKKAYKALKISPIPPCMPLFGDMVKALKCVEGGIQEVVACNTQPDVFMLSSLFQHSDGYCGMGGQGLHHTSLGVVHALERAVLSEHLEVTGCGGIEDYQSAHRMGMAGAFRGQIGTAFIEQGVSVFNNIGIMPND